MALTKERCQEVAAEVKAVCDDLKAAYYRAKALLASNSHLAIPWGSTDPAIIEGTGILSPDVGGNVPGEKFSNADVSNAIGVIDTICTTIESNGNFGVIDVVASV